MDLNRTGRYPSGCSGRRALVSGLIVMLITATGCATGIAVSDYCLIAFPISTSVLDTPKTEAQVIRHNAIYDDLCLEMGN